MTTSYYIIFFENAVNGKKKEEKISGLGRGPFKYYVSKEVGGWG